MYVCGMKSKLWLWIGISYLSSQINISFSQSLWENWNSLQNRINSVLPGFGAKQSQGNLCLLDGVLLWELPLPSPGCNCCHFPAVALCACRVSPGHFSHCQFFADPDRVPLRLWTAWFNWCLFKVPRSRSIPDECFYVSLCFLS